MKRMAVLRVAFMLRLVKPGSFFCLNAASVLELWFV